MKPSIQNKVVLSTGASSGIGEATARVLAERGARVLLGARRAERLDNIVADTRRAGGTAEQPHAGCYKPRRYEQIRCLWR